MLLLKRIFLQQKLSEIYRMVDADPPVQQQNARQVVTIVAFAIFLVQTVEETQGGRSCREYRKGRITAYGPFLPTYSLQCLDGCSLA